MSINLLTPKTFRVNMKFYNQTDATIVFLLKIEPLQKTVLKKSAPPVSYVRNRGVLKVLDNSKVSIIQVGSIRKINSCLVDLL